MTYEQLSDLIDEFLRVDAEMVREAMGPNTTMTIPDDEYQMYADLASLRGVVRDLIHAVTWRNPEIALEGVVARMTATVYERGEQIANSLHDEMQS